MNTFISKHLTTLGLIIAFVLALATRFYMLGEAPKGLYIDEAGQGYSAYSILKTGKDEFGKRFPVVFRSFTDFKTPVYIYLVVPLIPIFGLSAFTVRFPSFFFSILTIPLIFFLTKLLIPKKYSNKIGFLFSLLLALSPWHILFGRTNFECNVALFFFLLGIFVFYKSLSKPKMLILSAILLAIAIPSYHAQRVVTPLIVAVLFIKNKKKLQSKPHKRYLIIGSLLALIILLPTLAVATTPGFLARATGLNIFNFAKTKPPGYVPDLLGIKNFFANNLIYLSSKEFFSLYFSYLSPRNMFILGDYGPRSSFPELATFFLWQAPFYIIGLYFLIKKKAYGKFRFFMLSLLLVGPIPAAVTRDPYSSIRALQLVVPQTAFIAIGLFEVYERINNIKFKYISLVIFTLLITYSLAKLYSSVIVLNEYYRAEAWDYGWKEVANTIEELNPSLPVVIDPARENGYIQIAFYLKYPPEKYQNENFEVPLDEYYTNMNINHKKQIGNIITRNIEWKPDVRIKQYLVGDALAISDDQIKEHNLTLINEIYYPDGRTAFRIVKTNP